MATPSAAEHRDIGARLTKLEQQVRQALAVATRRPKFEVSDGDLTIRGGALVVDGGDFLLLDTDGSTVFRLGPQVHGDRGVTLSRETGAEALSVSRLFPGGDQQVRMRDRAGNEIVGEEALGNGLSRPFLTPPLRPVQETPGPLNFGPWGAEVPTASTAWTQVFRADFPRQNQFCTVRARVAASDSTTSAEVRLTDNAGGVLGQFLAGPYVASRPAGSTGYTEVSLQSIVLPGAVTQEIALCLEVRRTAGTGTLRVAVGIARGGT